jgi:hypothetical protein
MNFSPVRFLLSRRTFCASLAAGFVSPSATWAQLVESESGTVPPLLGDVRIQRYRVGVRVVAQGGPCRGIYATLPVPTEWPEQKVRIVEEDFSRGVRGPQYRVLGDGVKQMVISIPSMTAGSGEQAILTFELERAAILPPENTEHWKIPAKPSRDLKQHLGTSPYIETNDPKIKKFAAQAAGDHEGWRRVEAIYDAVREKVEYRNGDLKGARRALNDGWGDCEELTCLFIAAVRSQGVPARTVWVEGHCYPEFYLEDEAGNGCWHPCQAAGTRAFGSMPDQLPILQKGDDFRDPDRPGKSLRYVAEFLKGAGIAGGGKPVVSWIREGA